MCRDLIDDVSRLGFSDDPTDHSALPLASQESVRAAMPTRPSRDGGLPLRSGAWQPPGRSAGITPPVSLRAHGALGLSLCRPETRLGAERDISARAHSHLSLFLFLALEQPCPARRHPLGWQQVSLAFATARHMATPHHARACSGEHYVAVDAQPIIARCRFSMSCAGPLRFSATASLALRLARWRLHPVAGGRIVFSPIGGPA